MLRSLKGLYHLIVAIAANFRFGFPSRKLTVIGITGTDGKTTTTSLVYHILKSAGLRVSMITSVHAVIAGKTYDTGFHVTTPNAWWVQKYLREAADHGDTHMVLEVTSHALGQHRVRGVRFAVGAITNITHEHLDWHGTFSEYADTKMSLLRSAAVAVANRDSGTVMERIASVKNGKRIITYGMGSRADVNPISFPFSTRLPGTFNAYNVLAALAVSRALGIPPGKARTAVAGFRGVPGRMEIVSESPFRVIVDFAHTPNAIEQALSTARTMTRRRLIHVFGSAGLRDVSKRPLMGAASARYSDVIVLTEEDFRTEDVERIMDQIAGGIPAGIPVVRCPSRRDALTEALTQAKAGDTVIVTGKGHERSLARGKTEYAWSDQDEIRRILARV